MKVRAVEKSAALFLNSPLSEWGECIILEESKYSKFLTFQSNLISQRSSILLLNQLFKNAGATW